MTRVFVLLLCCLFHGAVFSQNTTSLLKLYNQGKLYEVKELSIKKLKKDPGNLDLNYLHGRVLADLGSLSEALDYLNKAVSLDTQKTHRAAWSYAYLGSIYYSLNEKELSKKYLDSCIQLDATKNATSFAKKRQAAYGFTPITDKWYKVETDNIIFHFEDTTVIRGIHSFIEKRIKAFDTLNSFFKASIQGKIDFYVWTDAVKASKELGQPLGFSLSASRLTHTHYRQTSGHELTHILHYHGVRPLHHNRMVSEGLAVAFDQSGRDRIAEARKAMEDPGAPEELSVEKLWSARRASDEFLYPVAGAWMDYLYKNLTPNEFISVIKDQTLEGSFRLIGKKRMKDLIRNFEKIINEK